MMLPYSGTLFIPCIWIEFFLNILEVITAITHDSTRPTTRRKKKLSSPVGKLGRVIPSGLCGQRLSYLFVAKIFRPKAESDKSHLKFTI